MNAREKWYGIVDSAHGNKAIMKLMEVTRTGRERCIVFKWRVTVPRGGNSEQRYKQLALVQNSRHYAHFFVEMTNADLKTALKS